MSTKVTTTTPATKVAFMPKDAYADVTCKTQPSGVLKCSISDDQLERIQERIAPGSFKHIIEKRKPTADEKKRRNKARLWKALWAAFQNLPIIKYSLYSKIAYKTLTAKNIVAAVEGNSGATSNNHNELRGEYKSSRLKPATARELGVIAMQIPLSTRCPINYDWENSDLYSNISSCEDVTSEIKKSHPVPVVMFTSKVPWHNAQALLGNPAMSPFYTRYANDGPIACTTDTAMDSAYHLMKVSPGINIDFIMRGIRGEGYLAWELKKSCTTIDGKKRTPDDLMFNFGPHIFETLNVSVDGKTEEHTLMISTVAVASTSFLKAFIPKRIPYHRFIGGCFAKMLLLEAKFNKWNIEKQ